MALAGNFSYSPLAAGVPANRKFPYGGAIPTQPASADPLTKSYNLYNTAVEQQAGDYGNIMQGFKKLASQGPSADTTKSTALLGKYAESGGLSPEEIANIRARGISPIRSVYSSAMRNVERQKGLQGGYSPNYAAVNAKMARELSSTLADKSTDVEGMIAELLQRGRLSAAPQYSAAASRSSDLPLQALQGQASLYGTTPALSSLFGSQALNAAQLQNQVNQQNQNRQLEMIGNMMRSF